MPPLTGELVFGLAGALVGMGISWGTLGARLSALKDITKTFQEANAKEHADIARQLEAYRELDRRVLVLEVWRASKRPDPDLRAVPEVP